MMPEEEFHISLQENAHSFCVNTPFTIPLAYCEKLKQEIDLLLEQGVITPETEPTDWCARTYVCGLIQANLPRSPRTISVHNTS